MVDLSNSSTMSTPAMEISRIPMAPADANATESKNTTDVLDLWRLKKEIPAPFVWPQQDTHPSSTTKELDVPVVDVGSALRDAAGMRHAASQVASACASHGFFQVTGHGVDPALARAALDGAADFFRLPLATKQRARRVPGTVIGYASAHVDRFAAKLPWKETLSFGHHHHHHDGAGGGNSHLVEDYFTSNLGGSFKHLGEVYQKYCEAMEEVSLAIMEVLGVSLGLGRGYYRDFFADGSSIMRCNYYPPCPEPERTLGTGPHCDPTALTILLQDGAVDGLQVLVDGAWRSVRPKPGELVVNIGDTFMVRLRMSALDLLGTRRRCRVASSPGRAVPLVRALDVAGVVPTGRKERSGAILCSSRSRTPFSAIFGKHTHRRFCFSEPAPSLSPT
uniref:Uncharacterized protein n=1 Tax=Avena sativa TaxID=4498 RepID=A0ACD5THF9_AVESA